MKKRTRNPVTTHSYGLKRRYGITGPEYTALWQAQGGMCASCGEPHIGKRRAPVDHDHITGQVRGILCSGCNVALGQLNESVVKAQKLIRYIRRHHTEKL